VLGRTAPAAEDAEEDSATACTTDGATADGAIADLIAQTPTGLKGNLRTPQCRFLVIFNYNVNCSHSTNSLWARFAATFLRCSLADSIAALRPN
jgi:hypothetical protein